MRKYSFTWTWINPRRMRCSLFPLHILIFFLDLMILPGFASNE
jgi:hypothetical protein